MNFCGWKYFPLSLSCPWCLHHDRWNLGHRLVEWNSSCSPLPSNRLMSGWKERLRSSSSLPSIMVNEGDSAAFKLWLQQSLLDPAIVEQYQQIFKPMLAPIQESLKQSNQLVDSLRKQLQTKDEEITSLRNEVTNLKVLYDDLEQHGRSGSMRIFGVPEHTTGTVDDKVLCLINKHLKVSPPLVLEDIEDAHRLGKPPPKSQVSDPPAGSDASADDSDQQPADSEHTSPSPVQTSSLPMDHAIVCILLMTWQRGERRWHTKPGSWRGQVWSKTRGPLIPRFWLRTYEAGFYQSWLRTTLANSANHQPPPSLLQKPKTV